MYLKLCIMWIHLPYKLDYCQALVSIVTKLWIPRNAKKNSSVADRVELIKKVRAPLSYKTQHSLNRTAGVTGIYVLLLSTCAIDIQSGTLQ